MVWADADRQPKQEFRQFSFKNWHKDKYANNKTYRNTM